MSTKSKTLAILEGKCPRCREGNIFEVSMASFRKITAIRDHCPVCNKSLHPEVDFYFGAMFMSYVLSVVLVAVTMVTLNVIFEDPSLTMYLVSVVVVNIILMPLMLRFSKVLYLYMVGGIAYRGY
jgi:uncharacterized protein (DUF983 family)